MDLDKKLISYKIYLTSIMFEDLLFNFTGNSPIFSIIVPKLKGLILEKFCRMQFI